MPDIYTISMYIYASVQDFWIE